MSIKTKLIEEFNDEIERLGKMELGSEAYKVTADGVTKLADRIIKIEESEKDAEMKNMDNSITNELKLQQMAEDRKDRIIKNCIEGTKVVGGFALATWAFVASMNFEKEGTLTTEGGRTALRSLLRFVK